jgi:hypothetical protein
MTTTALVNDQPTLTVTEEILVRASLEKTFASLLVQLGPENENGEGQALPMVIEPFPGGRWYRDLGGENGHLWGFVQSVKRPVLLEIWGPLFMSTAATSNIQYRLTETPEGTLLTFKHTLVGPFPEEHRQRMSSGWTLLNHRVRKGAETDPR